MELDHQCNQTIFLMLQMASVDLSLFLWWWIEGVGRLPTEQHCKKDGDSFCWVYTSMVHIWRAWSFCDPGTAKLTLQRQITKISRAAWWPCACLQFASKVSAVHELEMGVIPGVSLEGARAAFTATLNRPSRIIMRFGCHFLHILHDGLPWVSGC